MLQVRVDRTKSTGKRNRGSIAIFSRNIAGAINGGDAGAFANLNVARAQTGVAPQLWVCPDIVGRPGVIIASEAPPVVEERETHRMLPTTHRLAADAKFDAPGGKFAASLKLLRFPAARIGAI